MLKFIVWDIAKSLSLESFEIRLGKTPNRVRKYTGSYLGTARRTRSSLEATQNDLVHDIRLQCIKMEKGRVAEIL